MSSRSRHVVIILRLALPRKWDVVDRAKWWLQKKQKNIPSSTDISEAFLKHSVSRGTVFPRTGPHQIHLWLKEQRKPVVMQRYRSRSNVIKYEDRHDSKETFPSSFFSRSKWPDECSGLMLLSLLCWRFPQVRSCSSPTRPREWSHKTDMVPTSRAPSRWFFANNQAVLFLQSEFSKCARQLFEILAFLKDSG